MTVQAFLRILYPEVFWGAISSSGVPVAIVDFWQYFEAFRQFGPRNCVETTQDIVEFLDSILLDEDNSRRLAGSLKALFGFPNVSDNTAFASVATTIGLSAWQSRNWDPQIDVPIVRWYCANVTTTYQLYPQLAGRRSDLQRLKRLVDGKELTEEILNKTLNYIGYVNLTVVSPCAANGTTQEQCFVTPNMTFYRQEDLKQSRWRSWTWQ
jgi:hypothetical protein